ESNQFIQVALTTSRNAPSKSASANSYRSATRANALLIALAAQNRMDGPDADTRQLATLRDTAVKLGIVAGHNKPDFGEVVRLPDLLNTSPKLKADPNVSLERVRLKDTFTHDEISVLFGGCSGVRGQAIEPQWLALSRKRL